MLSFSLSTFVGRKNRGHSSSPFNNHHIVSIVDQSLVPIVPECSAFVHCSTVAEQLQIAPSQLVDWPMLCRTVLGLWLSGGHGMAFDEYSDSECIRRGNTQCDVLYTPSYSLYAL